MCDIMGLRLIVQTPGFSAPICGDGTIKRTAPKGVLMLVRSSRTRETSDADQLVGNPYQFVLRYSNAMKLIRRIIDALRQTFAVVDRTCYICLGEPGWYGEKCPVCSGTGKRP